MTEELPARPFAVGKVPPETLIRTVYSHIGKRNPRLLLGPGIGRDVAAVKNNPILILTTDPITGTSSRIGEHSVYVNANDVATAGAKPVWYLCTILLPPGSNERTLSDIMKGIDRASRKLGITVARGHTEATKGLDRPIIAGFMIGEKKGKLLRAENARAGDIILLTKTAGIEGTAIIASDHSQRLKQVPTQTLRKARRFSQQINVVPEALILSKIPGVRVLHDPTEGGVMNGCWELGEASHLGVELWADKIPVAQVTKIICSKLRLEPLKLMSSGCLLAVIDPRSAARTVSALRKIRVSVTAIGRMRPKTEGRKYTLNGRTATLVAVPRDELYKLA
jgi:hydrogenase expression/formation protein HypE